MHGRAPIIGLAVAAFLAGCGGEGDEATTLPSVTDSPTSAATSTATPTPSTSPAGAITEAQALGTTRAYYAALNQIAQEGGGYERYDAVVHPSCEPCDEQAQRLRQLTANGQHLVGGTIEIVEEHIDQVAGDTALVRVGVESLPGTVVDSDGRTVETFEAGKLSDRVFTVAITPEGARVVHIISLGER